MVGLAVHAVARRRREEGGHHRARLATALVVPYTRVARQAVRVQGSVARQAVDVADSTRAVTRHHVVIAAALNYTRPLRDVVHQRAIACSAACVCCAVRALQAARVAWLAHAHCLVWIVPLYRALLYSEIA